MQGRGWISEALELSDRFLTYSQIVEMYSNHPVNEVDDQVELVLFGVSAMRDCNILEICILVTPVDSEKTSDN